MERDEYGSSLVELFLALLAIVFMASLIFMPYLTGAVIGLVIYLEVPLAQSIVPGHPFMNYISILFVIEIIIAVLIHIKEIGDAVALCLSEVMVGTISMLLLNAAKPDSIGYCVFLTVAYLIGNSIYLGLNSVRYVCQKTTTAGIMISSIMYAVTAYFVIAIPAELLWQKYIEVTYASMIAAFNVIYLALRILICGGIVFIGILNAVHTVQDNEIMSIELPQDFFKEEVQVN